MKAPEELIRPIIRDLSPYQSARDDFFGEAHIFLDANESAYSRDGQLNTNRYPDSKQRRLRDAIGAQRGLAADQIFAGNGSDEAIDLLLRIFCEPCDDSIIITPPTYGMYAVAARIQDIKVVAVPLKSDFSLNLDEISKITSATTKIIFLCSPNNPTGACLPRQQVLQVLESFPGIVVIDEAYIDFCLDKSFIPELSRHRNLVIMHTFSKAWSLAGIRLGMAFGDPAIIAALQKVKAPYNINLLTQEAALKALNDRDFVESHVLATVKERQWLVSKLEAMPIVERVYPSDSNFLLVRFNDAQQIFQKLRYLGIIVRDRSKEPLCESCLRITVGSQQENIELVNALEQMGK